MFDIKTPWGSISSKVSLLPIYYLIFIYGFVYLFSDVAKFLPGTNFVYGAFEDCASAKICQVVANYPHLENVNDDRKFV